MHEYFYDVTTVRLAIIVEVIVTTLFYERVQLTTGGAIVPGYLSLFILSPLFIASTLLIAYLTFYTVNKLIAQRFILYGRRKFEVEILTTLTLVAIFAIIAHFAMRLTPLLAALVGIGFLIPAVIAHDMSRQGPKKTLIAVLVNTGIVGLFVYLFYSLARIAPGFAPSDTPALFGFLGGEYGFPSDLLLPAVFASVLVGMLIFLKLGLRSSGFVTGAYLALVLLRPVDVVFAVAVAAATYLFVTRVLMTRLLIFGRRKLSMMVLTGAIFAWAGEIAITVLSQGAFVPWQGFHVITLIVPALIANDAQRQGPYRTAWGTALTTVGVFSLMNLADAVRLLLL